jgi:DNA primase
LFFCFGCQTTKPLIELIMHTTGRSYFESARYIKSKEVDLNIEDVVNKALYAAPDFVQYDELLTRRLNKQALESPRAVSYFEGRRITKESMAKFDLGYSEKQDSVIVPMHSPDGMCIGFVARTIEGKEFKNTPGLPKSKILFNLHRVKSSKVVYVVESSFDAIRLDQVGFPAVATLGANVSSSQMKLLEKYFTNVVLVADNDEAGSIMADRLTEKLGSLVTVIKLDKQYKDIGDMNDDAIKQLEYQFDNSIIAMLK